MADQINSKYPKRLSFPVGEQRKFVESVMEILDCGAEELAEITGLGSRTIRDWRREKFTMSLPALNILCKKALISTPENVTVKKPFWYTDQGASIGGRALIKKYGRIPVDEKYRLKKWYEWWEKEGKFMDHLITGPRPINKPAYSSLLAEFAGIMLGDGGITPAQVTVTVSCAVDSEYSDFVKDLFEKLFGLQATKYKPKNDNVFRIIASRMELVKFCKDIGLVIGNKIKQEIDIPDWIKGDREYETSCLRGLVDTDGCIFTHKYKVKGKYYFYKKLVFTSYSKPLRESVYLIMKKIGLNPRHAESRDIRLDSVGDMKKYFEIVGSHNPKHLKKYTLGI